MTRITKSANVLPFLQWWKNLKAGVLINTPKLDASTLCWGAHVGYLKTQGLWSSRLSPWIIDLLDLPGQAAAGSCHVRLSTVVALI